MLFRSVPLAAAFLRPIAHRGLHDANLDTAGSGRIENTGPAFAAAIACGYGIECDLRPAAGGLPIVFHDETLDRLIDTGPASIGPGTYGRVASLTPADLGRLRYRGQDERIVTFAALLAMVAGAVPLMVEVKSAWDPPDAAFLSQIATSATRYRGPIALMSFDPAVVAILADCAPGVPRGLVSGSYRAADGDLWWHDRLDPAQAASLRELAGFDRVAASFCAYEVAALPTAATQAIRARGLPVFTWTVRTPADRQAAERHADAMIFEGFLP